MRKSAILSALAALVMLAGCGPEEVSSNGNGSGGGNTPEPEKVTEISVAQDKINVTSAGGSFTVQVTSNATLSVSVSSDWVRQSGSGYSFTADHNPGYDPRSCTITFSAGGKSKSVTVTQAQQDAIIPGETQYELFYEAQTFTLPVSTNVDLTVAPTVSWIKSQDTRALSQKNFSFSIEENSSKEPREGIIEITSGSLRQSIKVVQLPTTHFPNTKHEWKESLAMSYSIQQDVSSKIEEISKSGLVEEESFLDEILGVDDVIDVRLNESGSNLGVMQRDSLWVNYTLYRRGETSSDQVGTRSGRVNSHSFTRRLSAEKEEGNSSICNKGKALILAPFLHQFDNEQFILDWINVLKYSGFEEEEIDYYPDSKATILHYLGDNLSKYDFIIIDAHGGTFYRARYPKGVLVEEQTAIASGTVYDESTVGDLIDSGKLSAESIALNKVPDLEDIYLCMTTSFLDNAHFNNTCVILQSCETSKILDNSNGGSLIQTFLDRGCAVATGYDESIETQTGTWMTEMIMFALAEGLSFKDAAEYIENLPLFYDYCSQLRDYYTTTSFLFNLIKIRNFVDASSVNHTLFNYREKNPGKSYHLMNPYCVLGEVKPSGNRVSFSFASGVYPPAAALEKYDHDKLPDFKFHMSHRASYDLFVDDNRVKSGMSIDSPDYLTVDVSNVSVGNHKWYVVTHIIDNENRDTVGSYKSGVKPFEVTAPEVPAIKVTGVKVNPGTVTLEEGMSVELTATITPTDATNQKVIWSSDHPEFVTVDQTGVVTAVAANGSTRVYVTATTEDGNKTARCRVYVKEATGDRVPVTGINIVQSDVELEVGKTSELRAGIIPSNATNKSVQWTSSDPSVVTVTDGVLVAKGEGTATITAKTVDGGFTASVSVTVKKASEPQKVSVTAVSLNKSTLSLKVGESSTLRATISPSDATDKGVIWTSNRTSVATVSSSGVVTGKAAGTAVITVRTNDGGKTSTCNVTVTSNPEPGGEINVSQISISPSSATLAVGGTRQFSVTITPANATNQEVSWSSSNSSVASVNSDGLVTAKAEGQATITVTSKDGGFSSRATVTVSSESQEPGSYSLSPNPLDFGDVKVGSESTNRVMIRNTGKRPIQFSKVTSGDGVYLDMTVPFTLAVGEGRSFKVTFVPSEVRKYWVLISFTTDADNEAELLVQGNSTGQSGYSATTPEAVDLGLSVKWASFNVGATKPEGYGDYFAWGETKPKSTYTWTTYTLAKGSHTSLTKYCTDESYGYNGFTDGKKRLDSSDDAATASLGKGWRMPTVSELEELKRNCERTWTTVNGVVGCLLTSTINGNSIFIPQAGVRADSGNMSTSGGYYWTSDLDYDPYSAYNILFNENTLGYSAIARFCGLPIRAVYGD